MVGEVNRRNSGKRHEVTERDIEIVRWLGRHRVATAEQVMRRFEMHRTKTYDRLRVLVAAGLVRHEEGIRSRRLYLATIPGQSVAGLDLPRATVSASSIAHDLAVVDAAIELERHQTIRVLSEREIRRAGSSANPYHLRVAGYGSSGKRGAWPDLVVEQLAGDNIDAVEIELSLKARDRLREKLLAYSVSRYRKVIYLTGHRSVSNTINQVSRELGLSGRVEERPLASLTGTKGPSPDEVISKLGMEIQRLKDEHAAAARESASAIKQSNDRSLFLVREIMTYLDAGSRLRREIRERWRRELHRPIP